ncbi:hypothetical protein BC937DRAFT_86294 [Endogone sp. FLAS-F59071]|nr:hypothetical protein BC937DRAFT_86294 [Endogone sp. FLAS-F59071]|eukprot:RUS13127.1 hypothetical protein BC937DRAFT_86294 [Endogone sp. FLAS-F59071]
MSPSSTNLDVYNGQSQDLVQELLIEAQAEIISHRFNKAIDLLEQAVERGSANAAANLGTIYINGEPGKVTRDYPRGFQWFLRALTLSANATHVDCTTDLLDIVQTFTDIFKFHWIELDRNPVEWKEGYKMLRSLAKKLEQESDPVKLNSDDALQIEEDYRRAIR